MTIYKVKTWIISAWISIGMLGVNLSFAQPIVRITNTEDSSEVRAQVFRYLDYFAIEEKVGISVIFTKNMPDNMKGMTYCMNQNKAYPYLIIKVRIDARLSKREHNLVLAHEMIHVKQYVKGELKVIDHKRVIWKGRTLQHQYTGTRQRISPWEREAYRTDNLIANICAEQAGKPLLAERLNMSGFLLYRKK